LYHFLADFRLRSDSATWLLTIDANFEYLTVAQPPVFNITVLGNTMALTSLSISLTVNAIVMGLIVLRILKVYWKGRSAFDQTLGVGRDTPKLRSIIFILIESGMAMFSIQLIRVALNNNFKNFDALQIVIYINQMLNVIIRSVMSTFQFTEIVSRE
jgi:hypothetical protein